MRDDQPERSGSNVSRRTFVKGAGLAAGTALLGAGGAGSAAAGDGFDLEFANPRVREASKVWAKGIRGHSERTIGLTDTGIDGRHPDVGPWNGITVVEGTEIDSDDDGAGIALTTEAALDGRTRTLETAFTNHPDAAEEYEQDADTTVNDAARFSATVGPGAFVATGQAAETTIGEFTVPESDTAEDGTPAAEALVASLYWDGYNPAGQPETSNFNDLELRVDRRTDDGGWEPVATAASASMPETVEIDLEPGTYRYVAEKYTQTVSQNAYVDEYFLELSPLGDSLGADATVFDGSKLVGWYDAGPRFGSHAQPRDENGHGTHCASIMGGSGRASVPVENGEYPILEEPNAILTAGDFLEYAVEVDGGQGVFVAALGDGIEVTIEGPDGRTIEDGVPNVAAGEAGLPDDLSIEDVALAEAAVPPGEGGTYTCYVHATGESAASTGRVEKVAAGPLADPSTISTDGEWGDDSLHAGVAPNARLFGTGGLASPLPLLAAHGDEIVETFNLRSVNMSWGPGDPITGLATPPYGVAGGTLSDRGQTIERIAEHGILTCAAAGNSFTPGQTALPAVADEAVSVAATGPLDGLTSYSSGGTPAVDDDGNRSYVKPDVTAPGGYLTDVVKAAKAKLGDYENDDAFVQDYTGKAGTSMATPYANGVAGLVAEAMEFDLPEHRDANGAPTRDRPDGVTLPEPAATGLEDVERLKSVICATATETAFTAAPYHRAHAPTYGFGEKDVYEGYGRVNPDAAVDAVTNELVDPFAVDHGESTGDHVHSAPVGLNVPDDSRAVAGFVDAPKGTLSASVHVSHLSGGSKGTAKGSPHVDLFVYDASNPAEGGEPTVVAKAQGRQGSASVTAKVGGSLSPQEQPDPSVGATGGPTTLLVVAKLVNVPGVVNGFDVQAHLDLTTAFDRDELPPFTASGSRTDDGRAFTGGRTVQMDVTVSDPAVDAQVGDRLPAGWRAVGTDDTTAVDDEASEEFSDGSSRVVFEEPTSAGSTRTYTYFAKVPESAADSGRHTVVAEARPDDPTADGVQGTYRSPETWVEVSGTSADYVIVGTSPSGGSGSTVDGGSATGAGDGVTGDATGAVEDAADSLR